MSSPLPPFQSIPLYSIEAACSAFLAGEEPIAKRHIIVPTWFRVESDMFAFRVRGHCMEPKVQDRAIAICRKITGTRRGRYVLVEDYSQPAESRYTLKRYESIPDEFGRIVRILLHPLHHGYKTIELDPENEHTLVRGVYVACFRDDEVRTIHNLYEEIHDYD